MIKAIIFDVGGVLHTNESYYINQHIEKRLGVKLTKFKNQYKKLIDTLEEGIINEIHFGKKLIRFTKSKLKASKKSLFTQEYIKRYKKNYNVLKIVNKLRQKNYKLAILSNSIESLVRVNYKMGIYKDFKIKVFSHQVGIIKPDPKIYKLTLKKLQLEPKETVFIDDKIENVIAAKKLGMNSLLFKNALKLQKDLIKLKVL